MAIRIDLGDGVGDAGDLHRAVLADPLGDPAPERRAEDARADVEDQQQRHLLRVNFFASWKKKMYIGAVVPGPSVRNRSARISRSIEGVVTTAA